jgi:hypothetical protein
MRRMLPLTMNPARSLTRRREKDKMTVGGEGAWL